MTASEARKKALSIESEKSKKQLEEINQLIEDNAAKGNFAFTYYQRLLPAVETDLKNRGYTLSAFSDVRDGISTTISWI